MKWITEPHIHVLSVPYFIDHPEYVLPNGGNHSERLIAHAGKGCYDTYGIEGRSIEEHIRSLRSTRHGSVFEHACISLFISGVSRGCSHEIVRHRAGFAYSQRSTRYTKENDASFVLEPFYADLQNQRLAADGIEPLNMDQASLLGGFMIHCERSLEAYRLAVDTLLEMSPFSDGVAKRKWARGKARQLLPHALETRLTMTGNLRAWRFFLEERSNPAAEPEIRRLAMHVMNALEPFARIVFEDMTHGEVIDGFPYYKPEVAKV